MGRKVAFTGGEGNWASLTSSFRGRGPSEMGRFPIYKIKYGVFPTEV